MVGSSTPVAHAFFEPFYRINIHGPAQLASGRDALQAPVCEIGNAVAISAWRWERAWGGGVARAEPAAVGFLSGGGRLLGALYLHVAAAAWGKLLGSWLHGATMQLHFLHGRPAVAT